MAGDLFDHPAQFLQMGFRLVAAGQAAQAQALADRALAKHPGDPLIAALARRIQQHQVPSFHHGMLRDAARNAAYAQAIAALAPGRLVLDVGTGSGLLAMLAARAGAAHVHACELNPMVAATAREIIAANGLADRITVHAVHSRELNRVRDLAGGAELVVSEILSHDLLGEGVLPALAQVRAELCAPGALFVPERAAIRVALADDPTDLVQIGAVEGFDLALFNRHIQAGQIARSRDPRFALRSEPADLMTFDFAANLPLEGRATAVLAASGGPVNGIAQWLQIDLGGGATYENAPGAQADAHWGVGYYPLPAPRETDHGECIKVHGWHGEDAIAVWAEP